MTHGFFKYICNHSNICTEYTNIDNNKASNIYFSTKPNANFTSHIQQSDTNSKRCNLKLLWNDICFKNEHMNVHDATQYYKIMKVTTFRSSMHKIQLMKFAWWAETTALHLAALSSDLHEIAGQRKNYHSKLVRQWSLQWPQKWPPTQVKMRQLFNGFLCRHLIFSSACKYIKNEINDLENRDELIIQR